MSAISYAVGLLKHSTAKRPVCCVHYFARIENWWPSFNQLQPVIITHQLQEKIEFHNPKQGYLN